MSSLEWRGVGSTPTTQKAPEISRTSAGPGERRELCGIFRGGLSGHQDFLIGDMRRRGPVRKEGELEVVDDPVHHGVIRAESDDLHLSATLAGQGGGGGGDGGRGEGSGGKRRPRPNQKGEDARRPDQAHLQGEGNRQGRSEDRVDLTATGRRRSGPAAS